MDAGPDLQGSEGSPDPPPFGPEPCIDGAHGLTVDGQPACCKEVSIGIVDCVGCLDGELAAFLSGLDPQSKGIVEQIMPMLFQAASKGLTRYELQVRPLQTLHLAKENLTICTRRLVNPVASCILSSACQSSLYPSYIGLDTQLALLLHRGIFSCGQF